MKNIDEKLEIGKKYKISTPPHWKEDSKEYFNGEEFTLVAKEIFDKKGEDYLLYFAKKGEGRLSTLSSISHCDVYDVRKNDLYITLKQMWMSESELTPAFDNEKYLKWKKIIEGGKK